MKQMTAILQPHRLEKVEEALHRLPHLPGFTVFKAHGHARGHGPDHAYVADEWDPDSHPRLVLLIYCADEHVVGLVQTIENAARTGQPGDGIVAVTEVADIVRIKNGERGDAAV